MNDDFLHAIESLIATDLTECGTSRDSSLTAHFHSTHIRTRTCIQTYTHVYNHTRSTLEKKIYMYSKALATIVNILRRSKGEEERAREAKKNIVTIYWHHKYGFVACSIWYSYILTRILVPQVNLK